jgi:hypothetical protein
VEARPRTLFALGCLLLAAAAALPRLFDISDIGLGLLYGVAVGCLLASLLRRWLPEPCDAAPPALRRRYLREILPPMAGYLAAVWLSIVLLRDIQADWLRALVALLPVPPIAFAMRAIIRFIRDTDELQRRIELEAVSIATELVSMLYMAGGFLQQAKVIDISSAVAMIWVFPQVCLVYGLAKILISRRYR